MSNVFITGDSFAYHRFTDEHWPFVVAKKLNLKLTGEGFSGRSWWPSQVLLSEYTRSEDYINTDYYVFVHTQVYRPLGYTEAFDTKMMDKNHTVWKTHVRYFLNMDFQYWCTEHYFRQINEVTKNKKVIHLLGFNNESPDYRKKFNETYGLLNGIIIKDSLIDQTDRYTGNKYWDTGDNHFGPEKNIWLADKVVKLFENYSNYSSKTKNNVWVYFDQIK